MVYLFVTVLKFRPWEYDQHMISIWLCQAWFRGRGREGTQGKRPQRCRKGAAPPERHWEPFRTDGTQVSKLQEMDKHSLGMLRKNTWAQWAPVKILMWVVAIAIVIAFWEALSLFPGSCGNQHIRDQNSFRNRLGNGSRSCFVGFRCFGDTSCSFHLHAHSFHFAFSSSHFPFILLSCSFHLY